MEYLDYFVFIALAWGCFSLISLFFGENKPFCYNKLTVVFITASWAYLVACVPVFRDGLFIADNMQLFYAIVAGVLSVEVWLIIFSTLLSVGLAKTAHDPEHESYIVKWHRPLRQVIKPLWYLTALVNIGNAAYFLTL
ncbi:hypothetical protein [Psychrobium sp. 1_MG-2023]|uniref:hypothetical protein n=1 Tax=Psychrobium sp. 1_MG-2023 TaxID=3062624 RepID=UPI000C32C1AF|nr:hypothetical protein [Psychrobium sp. 1_MG-2023]MDP2559675.1 hypothetical protein [Psychrobium sp. 1_MG-2023]PKF59506.1 hypothetical protein CW748_01670 [Alteromonadales bacterium alter-6D02]